MSEGEMVWPLGRTTDSAYGTTMGDVAAQARWLDAVNETKIYAGEQPHDGLATDTLLHLEDWR